MVRKGSDKREGREEGQRTTGEREQVSDERRGGEKLGGRRGGWKNTRKERKTERENVEGRVNGR